MRSNTGPSPAAGRRRPRGGRARDPAAGDDLLSASLCFRVDFLVEHGGGWRSAGSLSPFSVPVLPVPRSLCLSLILDFDSGPSPDRPGARRPARGPAIGLAARARGETFSTASKKKEIRFHERNTFSTASGSFFGVGISFVCPALQSGLCKADLR